MNISLILAHPDSASFNHAIAATAAEELRRLGHQVAFHDLYLERFDPLLEAGESGRDSVLTQPVGEHCREIAAAEGIVIVHPNWWGQPPAMLKGWIDRALRAGVAYRFEAGDGGEGVPVGLLRTPAAVVFNTSNTPSQREREAFGDPLEVLWKRCIFGLCGVSTVHRRMFSVIVTSTALQRRLWLEEVRRDVGRFFPSA